MKVEKKLDNPITIGFLYDKQLLYSSEFSKPLPVDPGSSFKEKHYGFIFKYAENYQGIYTKEKRFKTQCEISSVTTINGKIYIYEKNKYLPWQISCTGNIVKVAMFRTNNADEKRYLKEAFGIEKEGEIKIVNKEAVEEIYNPDIKIKRIEPDSFTSKYFIR